MDESLNSRLSRLESVLSLVLEIDKVQSTSNGSYALMSTIHARLNTIMDVRNFYIALSDKELTHFQIPYFKDTHDHQKFEKNSHYPIDTSTGMLTVDVLTTGKMLFMDKAAFAERDRLRGDVIRYGTEPAYWVGIPLFDCTQLVIGAMVVQSYDPNHGYSAEDIALLRMVANVVGAAIERAKYRNNLEAAVNQRTQLLEKEIVERRRAEQVERALFEVASTSMDPKNPLRHYQELHRIISGLLPAPNFFVAFYDRESDEVVMAYFVDEKDSLDSINPIRWPLGRGLTSLVLKSRRPWLIDQDLVKELKANREIDSIHGSSDFVSWMGVPMEVDSVAIGAIVMQSYDDAIVYTQKDLAILSYVAQHISAAVSRMRASETLHQVQNELVERNAVLTQALEDLRIAQAGMVQQEKLASLGALVAGVAHEINTPLSNSLTAISHLEQEIKELKRDWQTLANRAEAMDDFFDTADTAIRIVQTNSQRAAKLVQSFKQISVDQSAGDRRTVQLNSYFNEVLVMLSPSLKKSPASVHVHCPEDLVLTLDAGALAQVMTNLIMNSLIHGFAGLAKGKIVIDAKKEGALVIVNYSDDGVGMDDVVLDKLFDPFFTTKRGTGGSGLGGHMIYSLVTGALNGSIKVDSKPGLGTHFEIKLPANSAAA